MSWWDKCHGGTNVMVGQMSWWDKCHGCTNVMPKYWCHKCHFLTICGTNVDLIEGGTNVSTVWTSMPGINLFGFSVDSSVNSATNRREQIQAEEWDCFRPTVTDWAVETSKFLWSENPGNLGRFRRLATTSVFPRLERQTCNHSRASR